MSNNMLLHQLHRIFSLDTAVPKEWANGKKTPSLHGWYAVSSLNISLLGVWILITVPNINILLGTPPMIDGTLTLIAGILSYFCDVVTFGYRSIFKILDRCCAMSMILLWSSKMFILELSLEERILLLITFFLGLACKTKGEIAMKKLQWESYLWWHSLWHFAGVLGLFIWISYRKQKIMAY